METVKTLKRGEDLTVLGSGQVVAELGEAGVMDRYQFVIVPVALGGGRSLFTATRKLRLVDHRTFRSGKVVLTYAT